MDYLPAIGKETYGFFIRNDASEVLDWMTFIMPFSSGTWETILAFFFVTLLVVKAFQFYHMVSTGREDTWSLLKDSIGSYMTIFGSMFGMKPRPMPFDQKATLRLILFSTFLTGNVLFMSYRASLTSELSVKDKYMPFKSLEGLLESLFR